MFFYWIVIVKAQNERRARRGGHGLPDKACEPYGHAHRCGVGKEDGGGVHAGEVHRIPRYLAFQENFLEQVSEGCGAV